MKIIQPNNTIKKIILIASAATVLLAAAAGYAYYSKIGPFAAHSNSSINLDKATQAELDTGNSIKEQSIDKKGDKATSGSDPAPAPQPIEGSDKKSVHAEITAANQNESTLQVRTLIQIVTSSGACTLSMTGPQGKTYTSTVDIQPLASSSTCKGYDIPLNQLSPGSWALSLKYESSDIIASASKEIMVK